MCFLLLKIITKSVLWHLLATFFGENSKNVKQKVFVLNCFCNTLQKMFIEYCKRPFFSAVLIFADFPKREN